MKLIFEAEVDCSNAAFDHHPLQTASGLVIRAIGLMRMVDLQPTGTLLRGLHDENGNFVGQATIRYEHDEEHP
jgi:hypothetical protein